ncbi:MAG: PilN domain-containing protein [Pseudohongiellaceae bacterium]
MANINLLPWRERKREEHKKSFFISLGVAAGIAVALLGLSDRVVNASINNQAALNEYLRQQIVLLDEKLVQIKLLREQKAALTERMAVIQGLQGTRPIIVRLFDELVRSLPEGVYYNSIIRTGDSISLEGVAESNNRISALMRDLDASKWFADPDLRQVNALPGAINDAGAQESVQNEFQLTVKVTTPGQELEGTEGLAQ